MSMESLDLHAFLLDAMFMSAHMMFCLTAAFLFLPKQVVFRRIMGWAMLLWGCIDLLRCLPFFGILTEPSMFNVLKICPMLMVPSFTMVMLSLVYVKRITPCLYALHHAPIALLLLASILFASDYDVNLLIYRVAYFTTIGYGIVMLFYFFVQLRRYNERILNAYADIEGHSLRWLHFVLLAFGLLLVFWSMISRTDFPYARPIFMFGSGLLTGYILYRISQQKPASVLDSEVESTESESQIAVAPESMPDVADETGISPIQETADPRFRFADKLLRQMEEERLWLDPDLNILKLSRQVGTNRAYLSTYLNTVLGKNFFDFVNDYRLQHAVVLLEHHPEQTIDEIAQASGFNNTYSFRRVFAKKYNVSPNEWRKQKI